MSNIPQNFTPESQKERWVKYGANVALASILVIVLAIAVTYLAQRFDHRMDTTAAGLYSLKPQTVNLIKDNTQKIKLISLYSAKDQRQKDNPFAGPVRDLLEEYSRKGKNIEFEAIDPVTQSTDAIVKEAVEKYGGAVKQYRDYLEEYKKTHETLNELVGKQAAALANVQEDKLGEDQRGQMLAAVVTTVRDRIPQSLTPLKERVDRAAKSKFPDYRAITDAIKDNLEQLQQQETSLIKFALQEKDDAQVPAAIKEYLAAAPEGSEAIRKLAEETSKKIDALGELKVSDLQQAVKGQDLILVLGDKDWRVIGFDQVWQTDRRDLQNYMDSQQEIKPRFAGEQAVTTAILALSSDNKQKVVFVRPGGGPLAQPGMPPFQRGGPLSDVADRLRDYNYDVLEKDISGMYEMQARMQGQQAAPEPTEDQIKDACWIVIDMPAGPQGGPSPEMAKKLADHLKAGGSALVLAMPQSDNLSEALKDYGIDMVTDATIVHEMPKGDRARSSDWSQEVQSAPIVFVLDKYGDHMLTKPLESLDTILAYGVPVRTTAVPGVKTTSLLPIPQGLQAWGERETDSINTDKLKFDAAGPNADLGAPLFAGAIAEKDKTRLVVIGGLQSFTNQVINWPDQAMLSRGIFVARFPGNAEMFTNSVFWLTHMEPMIAISPAAMQVSRIAAISEPVLNGLRIGVLLILLPGTVLLAGIWMYFARRD
ncbi:MAG TPA: Gldg family protein [Tepidisphaeraceae bacterium]|nr:Gldg family protein [Tepidisphaeraceae bacterium]